MAQANSTFYDLVIPKLYETVILTKENLSLLDYGHGPTAPTTHVGDAAGDDGGGSDNLKSTKPDGMSTISIPTRKDLAVAYCRRLIIDVTSDAVKDFASYISDRAVHQPYGNIDEIVITMQALKEPRSESNSLPTLVDIPFMTSDTMADETGDTAVKSKRLIAHQTSISLFDIIRPWWKRQTNQTPHQIILHGIMLPYPGVYTFLSEIRVECSFDLDSMYYQDDTLEGGLAHWLISVFSLPDIFNLGLPRSKHGLLKLHNIPALIFREEDRPEDKCEANRLARTRIEELLSEHESGKDDPELVKSVMKRIELVDREEPVEYPVSRPRPVGLLSTDIDTRTDVLGDLADYIESSTNTEGTVGQQGSILMRIREAVGGNPTVMGQVRAN